jgi:hypothetical protein
MVLPTVGASAGPGLLVWPRCNVMRTSPVDDVTTEEPSGRDAGEVDRSERACPVCGAHALALDVPPRIDVMGVQAYSDILGMGDRGQEGPLGIVCRSCGTYWRDLAAFERGEPEEPGEVDPS